MEARNNMSGPLNLSKLKSEVLYILQKTGKTDFHKLFKILYFADMWHLRFRGRPIVKNDYVAMPDGPVPSTLYDIIKDVKFDTYSPLIPDWRNSIKVEGKYFISAQEEPDIDELSENDIITLDEVIEWAKYKSKEELTALSHGHAYSLVFDPKRRNNPIDLYEIAKEAGASEDQISILKERDTLHKILSKPIKRPHSSDHNVCCTCDE